MTLKHLFVARHGDYNDYSGRISIYGKEEMERLGKAIKEILRGESPHIISSQVPRAFDSSQILADELDSNNSIEQSQYISETSDGAYTDHFSNPERLAKYIDKVIEGVGYIFYGGDSNLLIVTHRNTSNVLYRSFLRKLFGEDKFIGSLKFGEAFHFDLVNRKYEIIPKWNVIEYE